MISGPGIPFDTDGVATHDVSVGPGIDFFPANQTVEVGDKVHWFWAGDGLLHYVVSGTPDGVPDGIFSSGPPTSDPSTTFDVVFDQAFLDDHPMLHDEYRYFCDVHVGVGMTGIVRVLADPWAVLDFDEDGDVDPTDFSAFQLVFTGPL